MPDIFHRVPKTKWAKTIKELHEWRCAYCGAEHGGSVDTRLEAHHIYQRETNPELDNAVENGIALCHKCHLNAHNGCYQVYLDKRRYGKSRRLKKEGPVYDFAKRAFDTVLYMDTEDYDRLSAAASAAGESVNGYIKKAIDMRMESRG